MGLQSLANLIFPPQCVLCEEPVDEVWGLCPTCWADTPFIRGAVCDDCGLPLIGEAQEGDLCDDCLEVPRPWARGRAALVYSGNGRRIAMRLKHGDRTDLARPAGSWMAAAAGPLVTAQTVIVPVPAHWWRLARRRYNQAALLSGELARRTGAAHCVDALVRTRATASMDRMPRAARFANVAGAVAVSPKRRARIAGRDVVLVDDVFTSGATFGICAEACLEAGAARVDVVSLARVAKSG